MGDRPEPLLDLVGERALLGLLAGVAVYFLLSGIVGPEWAWIIVRAGILFAILYAGISAAWTEIEGRVHKSELRKRELKARDKEIDRMTKENERLRFVTRESMGNFLAVDVRSGETSAWFRPVSPKTVNVHGADHPAGIGLEGAGEPVMPLIQNAVSLLIQGEQGAGKTTLLHHIHDSRRAAGRVMVLNAHGFPGQFGPDTPVIGCGRDYAAIDEAMSRILALMDSRYDGYERKQHEPLTIIIDEFSLLHRKCKVARDFMESALTEFRKVGLSMVAGVHSLRAKFLNLEGGMDMAEGVYQLSLKVDHGSRWGELAKYGTEPRVVSLPGPHPLADGPGASGAGAGYPYQSGGSAQDDDIPDAEFSEADGPGPDDAPEKESHGAVRRLAGLLGFHPRPKGATKQTDAILKALYKAGRPMAPAEVAEAAKLDKAYTRQALRRMLKAKQVASPERGRYAIKA